ncbi:MAG TPA: hypothetical protein VIM16_18490 [Mucilaginibacter sp.]|jgi:hypothetical protein
MISHQQKGRKQAGAVKSNRVHAVSPVKKTRVTDGSDMTYNPELDKFSGDEFVPEKYKEDGVRLANSTLPHSSRSFK